MKINSIILNGFRSHLNSKLEALGKLVLVLGPNGSGKSGFVDAIAYAFTGACRGTDEAGRGHEVLLSPPQNGKPSAGVLMLSLEKMGGIQRLVGQGPKSQAQERLNLQIGLDRNALRCALRSQIFLDMDAKEQEALMRALILTKVTPEQAKAAIGAEVSGIEPAQLVTLDGVVNAYNFAFAARTTLKKQLDSAGSMPTPPEDVEWSGEKASAADDDALAAHSESAEAVMKDMNERRKRAEKTQWLVGEKKTLNERLVELRAKIAPYPKKEELEARIKELKAAADEEAQIAEKRRRDARTWQDKSSAANAKIDALRSRINRYEAAKSKTTDCESCGQSINKARLRQVIEEILAEIPELEKTAKAAATAAKKLDDGGLFPGEAQNKLQSASNDLTAFVSIRAEGVKVKTRLTEIDGLLSTVAEPPDDEAYQRVAKAITLLALHIQHRVNLRRAQGQLADLTARVEDAEKAVKALAPGGPVRALHMGAGLAEILAEVSRIAVTLGLGEVEISTAPKWTVNVNGRPADVLSASERFRVSLAFSVVIAQRTRSKIICLDGADILDDGNRDALMTLIEGLGMDQVIVTATSAKSGVEFPGWTTVYFTTDEHGFTRVKQLQAA